MARLHTDDSGWITIDINSAHYKSHMGKAYNGFSSFTANQSSSSTSVSGGASYFGIGANGGYHRADGHADQESTSGHTATTHFHNDAKDVSISFQFGIVDIVRPWLLGDLFYLRNSTWSGRRNSSATAPSTARPTATRPCCR